MSERKIATLVEEGLPNFSGRAHLYRCDPPLEGHEYVVVSAVVVRWTGEPETCIFPGNEKGAVTSWDELDGSFQGGCDHERALRNAGYAVRRRERVA